jgi:hypothetical protein
VFWWAVRIISFEVRNNWLEKRKLARRRARAAMTSTGCRLEIGFKIKTIAYLSSQLIPVRTCAFYFPCS